MDLLDSEPGLDLRSLLEVAEDAHGGTGLARGKHAGVVAPHEAERGPITLVAPGQRGVDNVLAVAAHRHKAPVGAVHQAARVHVGTAKVLDRQRQPLSIRLQPDQAPLTIISLPLPP